MTPTFTPKVGQTLSGMSVVRLGKVSVNRDRTLEEAIRVAAPNTPTNYVIWRAAGLYPKPADKSGVEQVDLNLVGPGCHWGSQAGIDNCDLHNWPQADPWETYAVQENFPTLHCDLGLSFLGAVCLQERKLGSVRHLPCAWWGAGRREAGAHKFDDVWGDVYYWVVRGKVI